MTQKFALIFGIIYVAAGILGFVPGLLQAPAGDPPLVVEAGHGRLLGLFSVNVLHNIVHLIIGIWGIVAYRSVSGAVLFARSLAVFYGLLTVLGLIPATYTLFGLVPIHGYDVWLHALSAVIAAYFGFGLPAQTKAA
jgi:hypothetical protein